MIPFEFYHDWIKLEYEKPYKGQLVEVLVYQPAIYLDQNEYGAHIWDQFTILEKVVYWRPLKDKKAYEIVYKELLRRQSEKNSLEK